jgi:hypothetical protein
MQSLKLENFKSSKGKRYLPMAKRSMKADMQKMQEMQQEQSPSDMANDKEVPLKRHKGKLAKPNY